jgi:hypothetical protein
VDQRCGRCHSLDRVYTTGETPQEWSATISRMVSYAAGSAGAIQPGEDQQIIAYLSATQTPEAVKQRLAQGSGASSTGRSMVTQKVSAAADHSTPSYWYDGKTIGFISLVCLGMLTLVIRRPTRIAGGQPEIRHAVGIVPSTGSSLSGPLILRLASITAADLGLKNPAVHCSRRPEASPRGQASFLRSLFSSMEKSHPVVLDMFIGGEVGLRRDHAEAGSQGCVSSS